MIPAASQSEPQASLARHDGHTLPSRPRTPSAPSPPWSFGSFVLDPARRELLRDGERQHVEPKVLDLLAYLVRHRDRVVSRDEILDALWRDEHVSDAALGYCVKAARRAIGDSGEAQHTIATEPRRGFRFVAEVTGDPRASLVAPEPVRSAGAFVGREAVLARLTSALAASRAGTLRVALIAGEPGIGKTRLADEISRFAHESGTTVLTGRCHESVGTPPFWPWTQVLRASETRRAGTVEVEQLSPELQALLGHADATPSSADQRFRLFDAIRGVLQRVASERPLLIVLDDLQWSDPASLLLLRFLARELRDVKLMLLAVYRDTDVGPGDAMLACAADLVRVPGSERVQLGGLGEPDLARFLLDATGSAPPALVERIHARTGGNPFFATEAVRLLLESGVRIDTIATVPGSVRDVVARRVATLPEPAQALLRVAAVLGREFALSGIQHIREPALRDRTDLLGALDAVLAARLVEHHGRDACYRFAHDLVRETIYDAMPSDLRARLHEEVGQMLEAASVRDDGDHLAALAHHFDRAALAGDPGRAIAYTVRAAERAASLLAYEEAVQHYERAIELDGRRARHLGDGATDDPRWDVAVLLLQLGENCWKSGEISRARDVFRRAIALARVRDDAALLARAALGFGGDFRGFDVLQGDAELVTRLEEALARLPSEPSALRGRVMARLAIALYDVPASLERRIQLSAAAVVAAETTRDRAALAAALYTRHWAIWGPDTLADRITAATAMQRLAVETGDQECALHAHRFLAADALERGERADMDRHIAACGALADALGQPYYRWFAAQLLAMRSLLAGRIDDSERLLEEAHAIGRRSESRNVALGYQALRFWILRERGRAGEVEPLMRAFVEGLPAATSWHCALAMLHVELGDRTAARRWIDFLATDEFATIPRNAFWLASMIMVADSCAGLQDAPRARVLHGLLAPYAGRVGELAVGGGCLGSIDRALGRLARVIGNDAAADDHFAAALRLERGLEAPLLVARTERDRAWRREPID